MPSVASVGDVVRQAREVVAMHGRLPGEQKLRLMGLTDVARLVNACGGSVAFCERFGVSLPPVERALPPDTPVADGNI
jgi:hypothetical protein